MRLPKHDIENATTDLDHESQPQSPAPDISHYKLAEQMVNYQSVDVGAHCEPLRAPFVGPATNSALRSLRRGKLDA